jgi:hypothetical protein
MTRKTRQALEAFLQLAGFTAFMFAIGLLIAIWASVSAPIL